MVKRKSSEKSKSLKIFWKWLSHVQRSCYQLINLVADYEILLKAHSDGIIKEDKYFYFAKCNKYLIFIKVGAANVLLKLNCLESRADTTERPYLSHPAVWNIL